MTHRTRPLTVPVSTPLGSAALRPAASPGLAVDAGPTSSDPTLGCPVRSAPLRSAQLPPRHTTPPTHALPDHCPAFLVGPHRRSGGLHRLAPMVLRSAGATVAPGCAGRSEKRGPGRACGRTVPTGACVAGVARAGEPPGC